MCRSVLNDEWVSHPTWASEDTGFYTHKKNIYEDALHRSEEERHEYDFHIEAISRTIVMLEPISTKIASMPEQERHTFKLKPNFGGSGKAIHQRLVKKIYGRDAGGEVIKAMQDSPALAVPVVLARLKQKEEEWKRAQREWNKVWREVDARNYAKSLDYQSVTFKAADKKATSARTFISQIEALRDQQHARRAALIDPLFARTRPRHQVELRLEDEEVLKDALKLTFSYLDRTQGQISFADRRRIEGFLRSFVPILLGLDQTAFQTAFAMPGQTSGQAGVWENGLNLNGVDGASDVSDSDAAMSVVGEDGGDEYVPAPASTGKRSSSRSAGKAASGSGGSGAVNGSGGDLRKRLLKSEQAKSTSGRKTRGQGKDGSGTPSPAGSRFSSPAVFDKPASSSAVAVVVAAAGAGSGAEEGEIVAVAEPGANAGKTGKAKYPFFCNVHFYVLVRLLEVSLISVLFFISSVKGGAGLGLFAFDMYLLNGIVSALWLLTFFLLSLYSPSSADGTGSILTDVFPPH